MSCDGNRTKYFEHVVAGAGADADVAAHDLEALYQANRGQPADKLTAITVEAKTRQLFGAMQQAGFKPPTHTTDGLPKTESQPGYAAVYDFIKGRGWLGKGLLSAQLTSARMNAAPRLHAAANPQVVPVSAVPGATPRLVLTPGIIAGAKNALSECPELADLAVNDYTFKQGPQGTKDYYQLMGLANALLRDPALPAEMRVKAHAFQINPHNQTTAVAWAEATCTMSGMNRCPKCQRWSSPDVAHTCPAPRAHYDRNGYDRHGFNREGRNKEGFDRNGRDRQGYDRSGFKDGYSRQGYDSQGYNRQGLNAAGYDRNGRDRQGYDRDGFKTNGSDVRDRQGYDKQGYDKQGFDQIGYTRDARDRNGKPHPMFVPDANGMYGDGLDAWGCGPDGYTVHGRDRYGFDRHGFSANGYDRNGYDKDGRDANGFDRDGYNAQGFKIAPDGVLRNRLGYDDKGFDASGCSWTGYDKNGLDRNGNGRMTTDRKGNPVPVKFNVSGWDKDHVDRWGYSKKTGLTPPDAQGIRRNPWGWIYDPATQECYDPADPTYRVPHTGDGNPYGQGSWMWDKWGKKGVTVQGKAAAQPPSKVAPTVSAPPITPFAPLDYASYRKAQGHLNDYAKAATDGTATATYATIQNPQPETRWATSRARFNDRACANGVLLKCPHCGQFTNGSDHQCPSFPDQPGGIRTTVGGAVLSGQLLITAPHNPDYDWRYAYNGYTKDGYDADGYDRQGYNRQGQDRDGYNREGYDVFGYDRQGYNRDGYNRSGKDRDGHDKPKTLMEAARNLDEQVNPLSNKHLEDLYSRLCTGLVGKPRRVYLKPGARHVNTATGEQVYITSGFATDMKGKITADPTPLGPDADPRDNLIVTRAGLYHEIGHEQFTPPELWAAVLEANKSTTPYSFETADGGTLTLDAGRRFLPQMYNIVEDGRMEREVSRTYPGAGEILAASCRLEDRWSWEPGRPQDDYNDLTGALLYEALPYYKVRPEVVEERLSPRARKLFEELRPLVQRSVRGSTDDAFNAAVLIAKRLEEEGVVDHDSAQRRGMTPPPPPPPGTKARRPKITIDGDQVFDASQMGGGGGGPEMDVEFTGHVTIKNADQIGDQQGGGSATFSGGVTYEGGQPQGNQQQHGQQGGQQGDQAGGQSGGPQSGQQGGQSGGQAGGQAGGQQGSQQAGGAGGSQGGQGGVDDEQTGGGGRGRSAGAQEDETPGNGRRRGGGSSDDDQPKGRRPAAADDDEAGSGSGRGRAGDDDDEPKTGRGGGQDDDPAGRTPGANDDPSGGSAGAGTDDDDGSGTGSGGSGADDDDADDWGGDGDGWDDDDDGYVGDVDDEDGEFADDGGTVSGSTGSAGRGGGGSLQGGSGQLRDWDSPFTEQQIQDAVAAVEATAAAAIDEGVRAAATPEAMGRDLHRPLDDRPGTRQRYKTADGRVETVPVATPKSGNAPLKEKLEQRRPKHKQIARDLAKQLKAIREQTEQRIRFQKDGRIDRRRFVAAVKGAEDVKTKTKELPATSFAASVAVDLSGSMSTLIQNGSLFDATMILSDTFEDMDIAHEVRGFGSDAAHFKSMGDPRFDPDRSAMLAAGDRGGTNMAGTAGLATQALRAREEGNKLFVSLSDGSLGDHREAVAILKEARRNGVVTFGIFLGSYAPEQQMDELYGPGNWVQINELKEFPVTVGRRISQIFKQMR